MKSFGRVVVAASAAVAFTAGSALVAPVVGAAPGSLNLGSLGTNSPDTSLPADATCDVEQIVTPSNLAESGWSTPTDESKAVIGAVTDAPATVGDAALTFAHHALGTSLYKNVDVPLADILEEGKPIALSYEYTASGQAPALQIRLNDATVDKSTNTTGFASIYWSPEAADGVWKTATASGDAAEFRTTRDILNEDGTQTVIAAHTATTLEAIVGANPDAKIVAYGVQQTKDNTAADVAIDNFTFGCETTNFELDPEDTGSLSGIFGSLTGSLS